LLLTPSEGALLTLDDVHGVQFGIKGKDKDYCETLYTVKETRSTQNSNKLTQKKEVILLALNRLLPDLTVTFDLISDTVIRQ